MSECWFLPPPPPTKVTLIYVHPMTLESWREPAARFVETLLANPPGHAARLIVVCNGERAKPATRQLFAPLAAAGTPPEFAAWTNEAFDVGAYQYAARTFVNDCDLMVFFGASTYFRRAGWLKRMVESWETHGDGLYGATANRGVNGHCAAHIRTTAFWMPPSLFNEYPHRVTRADRRYEFEHGPTNLTGWVARQGLPTMVVSTQGEYKWEDWDSFPGGYHRHNQEVLLVGDRLTAPPYYPIP
jgi:hypothetical protein